MSLYLLTCPGQPVSGKNHKDGFVVPATGERPARAVVVTGKAVRRWMRHAVPHLAQQFARYAVPTIAHPVHVELHQFLRLDCLAPSSPDGDNVQSAVWDALVHAGVLRDDKLIMTWGGTRQTDGGRPRVEIEIRVR